MEHKIGEIFEFKKEWYQCVEGRCKDCYFSEKRFLCKQFITKGFCNSNIIFKKLERVGKPYIYNTNGDKGLVKMQEYKLYDANFCKECDSLMLVSSHNPKRISIEIKQNKEDMEEKKFCEEISKANEVNMVFKIASKYINGGITYDEFEEYMRSWINNSKKESKPNLKPFDLQKAREGKSVCTRDGHKARIICTDANIMYGNNGNKSIIVLITKGNGFEYVEYYTEDGKFSDLKDDVDDLMMLPEKKEGWVNVYKHNLYDTESEAKRAHVKEGYIDTIKIEWEE